MGLVGEYEYTLTPKWTRLLEKHPKRIEVNTKKGVPKIFKLNNFRSGGNRCWKSKDF
jgi:hypothetical protein